VVKYTSYKGVNGLLFNDSPEKAIEIFGEPNDQLTDSSGNLVFTYKNMTISFDKNKRFFYFALHPKTAAKINDVLNGWTLKDIKPIIALDSNPQESSGFIILRDLGVALVDFNTSEDEDIHNKTIVFFRNGELKKSHAEKPFKF